MTKSFSATKVRVAFECPRLFYLGHRFGGSMMFLPKHSSSSRIGTQFHALADRFAFLAREDKRFRVIFQPDFSQLQVESVAIEMQQLFYELEFYPYLQRIITANPSKAQPLLQTWESLVKLIHHWAKLLVRNRQYCDADSVIGKTLLYLSPALKHEFLLPNQTTQLIQGRFDSINYDFTSHQLCLVEYKTYTSPDKSAQMMQAAIYSYILQEKIGIPITSVVYSILPEWQELKFSGEEMQQPLFDIIPPKLQQMQEWITWEQGQPNPPPPTLQRELLCDMCSQKNKCQTFFGDSSTTFSQKDKRESFGNDDFKPELSDSSLETQPVSPAIKSPPASPILANSPIKLEITDKNRLDPDEIGKDLVRALQSFGVKVDYVGAAIAPAFIRIKLRPREGVRISAILRSSQDLRVQLSLDHEPLIAAQSGYVSVDLPRRDRQVADFDSYISKSESQSANFAKPLIAIGVNLEGKLIEADLSDPNTCHFLVGGTTGSGKSEFLRSLLLSLLVRHSPKYLKIALVDPKRVTFPEFENMPWLYSPVVKDAEGAIGLMINLMEEMDSRYQLFEMAKCADVTTYNQRVEISGRASLPRIVCIFDEYADFMSEKSTRAELEVSIKRLGAMARAAGIHLIIATQRPEAKVVTPIIRSNLPGRVALRTASEADSIIILGGKETDAAKLLGKGDLLFQVGANLLRLQSLLAPTTIAIG